MKNLNKGQAKLLSAQRVTAASQIPSKKNPHICSSHWHKQSEELFVCLCLFYLCAYYTHRLSGTQTRAYTDTNTAEVSPLCTYIHMTQSVYECTHEYEIAWKLTKKPCIGSLSLAYSLYQSVYWEFWHLIDESPILKNTTIQILSQVTHAHVLILPRTSPIKDKVWYQIYNKS